MSNALSLALPPVAAPGGVTVAEAVNSFLRAKASAGRSDRYLRALRVSLCSFAKGRHQSDLGEVTLANLETWLAASKWAAKTRRGYLSDVRTLFNWCVRRGLVAHNPANGVELPAVLPKAPALHSPAQVRAVLEFARRYDPNLCRVLAVRYFAGLRSSEADRLSEEVTKPGYIEVAAQSAKTRRRRLVTVQPALSAWLALGGSFAFGNRGQRWRAFTKALAGAVGVPWPYNVTRHTFCSYHLAHFRNAAETALQAGHSEAMLFGHYRELATPEAAAEFWGILPE